MLKKYKVLIVDDEPVAHRIIQRYLDHFPGYDTVGFCQNAFEARAYLLNYDIDLMFLDLEMPRQKGLNFIKTLKKRPEIVIVTAYREYAVEGFELEVLDYLLKPVALDRFTKALNKFRDLKNTPTRSLRGDYIFLFFDRKSVKVRLDEILFLEGLSNYVRIKLITSTIVVYYTMSKILEKLDDRFIRVHRSFIINKDKIQAFTKDHIEIGDKIIPIGKSYRAEIEELFSSIS
ncbi:MAG: response regulator transcription factor [Saprospiraceae bacterium]|nr:response regulator transcription factor [Saprospiraceae bacterium]